MTVYTPEEQTGGNQGYQLDPKVRLVNYSSNLNRRQLLSLGAAITVGTLLTACGSESEKPKNSEDVLVFSDELFTELGDDGVEAVKSAFDQYNGAFGCPPDSIELNLVDLSDQIREGANNTVLKIIEQAGPGYINFDVEAVSAGRTYEEQIQEIRNTTLHALTHACQTEPIVLGQPFSVPNGGGDMVTGFQGMALLVNRVDGSQTAIKTIEEGICEALAAGLDQDYRALDFGSFQIGTLTLGIINTWSSPEEVAKMVQDNDVVGFTRLVRGVENPTQQDIMQVAAWYQMAERGEDLSTIQENIVQTRGG